MKKLSLIKKRELLHDMYESPELFDQLAIQRHACRFLEQLILNEFLTVEIKNSRAQKRKYPLGQCYSNATKNLRENYEYVEGYVVSLESGLSFQHAWNIDIQGKHLDFTFSDRTELYTYRGVVIPSHLVYEVGERKGCIWGPTLPFLTEDELQQVRSYNQQNNFHEMN